MSSETTVHLPSKKKVRFTLENKQAASSTTRWASIKVQIDDGEYTSHEFCIFFRTPLEQDEFNKALMDAAMEYLSPPRPIDESIPLINDSIDGE
jgi:hypothetical protein